MSDDHKDFNLVTCCNCGVPFAFSTKLEELWRRDEKTFYCPNGHPQVWKKPEVSEEQKELKKLREEVKSLKTKLDEALTLTETQKKKIEELTTELEIWRPSSADKTETKDGSEQAGSGDRAG